MNKHKQKDIIAVFIASIQHHFTVLTISFVLVLGLCSCQRHPSPSAIHLAVPNTHQSHTYDCGLAAIDSLYQYYMLTMSTETRDQYQMQALEAKGLSGTDLQRILTQDGFQVFIISGTLDAEKPTGLAYHLQKGRPCIVLLGNRKNQKHFVVAKGCEPNLAHWYFMDPATGNKHLNKKDFMRLWEQAQFFCLIAVPKKKQIK